METQQGVLSTVVLNMWLPTASNTFRNSCEVLRYFCQISTNFGVFRQILGEVHYIKFNENPSSARAGLIHPLPTASNTFRPSSEVLRYFCQISTNFGVFRQILGEVHNIKFHENPSSGRAGLIHPLPTASNTFRPSCEVLRDFCQISTNFGIFRQIFGKVHNFNLMKIHPVGDRTDASGEMDKRRDMAKRTDALGDYANAPNEQAYRTVGPHFTPSLSIQSSYREHTLNVKLGFIPPSPNLVTGNSPQNSATFGNG
jgi:hypothetical protein